MEGTGTAKLPSDQSRLFHDVCVAGKTRLTVFQSALPKAHPVVVTPFATHTAAATRHKKSV
jgi:hypothetical protein